MKNSNSLVVSNIKQETVDSVVVSFKIDKESKSVYAFKAGQYLTLCSKIKGKEIKRSYSYVAIHKAESFKLVSRP